MENSSKSKYQDVESTYLKRENPVLDLEWKTLSKSHDQDIESTYLKRENSVMNHQESPKAQLCTCKLKLISDELIDSCNPHYVKS
jgi:hypothetical protein